MLDVAGPADRLAEPPIGIVAEPVSLGRFELLDGTVQADAALLDQIHPVHDGADRIRGKYFFATLTTSRRLALIIRFFARSAARFCRSVTSSCCHNCTRLPRVISSSAESRGIRPAALRKSENGPVVLCLISGAANEAVGSFSFPQSKGPSMSARYVTTCMDQYPL